MALFGGSKRPRVAPEAFRTFEELLRDVQPGMRTGIQFGLEQQQAFGPQLTQAFLASARAGAPEQTALALQRLQDLQAGGLPRGEVREFEEAFRSRATAQLGTLGAQQPRQVFEEALERARLLREQQERALGLLPAVGPADIFSRVAPTLETALTVEQQRGANIQAMLNARASATAARRQQQQQLAFTGLLGAAGAFTGMAAPALFGAATGGGGALFGGLTGMSAARGGGPFMAPQPAFSFPQQQPLSQTGIANQPFQANQFQGPFTFTSRPPGA